MLCAYIFLLSFRNMDRIKSEIIQCSNCPNNDGSQLFKDIAILKVRILFKYNTCMQNIKRNETSNIHIHVKTQYSVDPGHPRPLSYTYSEPISNIFTFLKILRTNYYIWTAFLFLFRKLDSFLGKKAKTYRYAAW